MQMYYKNISETACLLMLAAVLTLPELTAQSNPLDQARSLVISRTSADQAKALLQQAIAADPKNAEPHFLLGEILYAFGDFAKASDEAQKAIGLDDTKSDYHLLLGNALSGMIDSVGMFKKMSLGRQMRTEFEKAVAEKSQEYSRAHGPRGVLCAGSVDDGRRYGQSHRSSKANRHSRCNRRPLRDGHG